jgi:anti-sigma B factor antagonist
VTSARPDDHPEPALPIEVVSLSDEVLTVFVRGEIDLTEAGELRAVLSDACTGPHRTVIVDLSGVGFMGSSGMGVLAQQSAALEAADRSMQICGSQPRLLRAFEVTGLDQVLELI